MVYININKKVERKCYLMIDIFVLTFDDIRCIYFVKGKVDMIVKVSDLRKRFLAQVLKDQSLAFITHRGEVVAALVPLQNPPDAIEDLAKTLKHHFLLELTEEFGEADFEMLAKLIRRRKKGDPK